jgi:hypothetical protein
MERGGGSAGADLLFSSTSAVLSAVAEAVIKAAPSKASPPETDLLHLFFLFFGLNELKFLQLKMQTKIP